MKTARSINFFKKLFRFFYTIFLLKLGKLKLFFSGKIPGGRNFGPL